MAKFDWTKVAGYQDGMSDSEKLQLLNGFEIPDEVDMKGYIKKEQFDKLSSDYAALKKEQRDKMSEAEKADADRNAELEQMRTQLADYKREKTMSDHKANLLAQGYSEERAAKAAAALVDGDTATLFAVMAEQKVETEKGALANGLRTTPTPPPGGTPATKEQQEEAEWRAAFGLPPKQLQEKR